VGAAPAPAGYTPRHISEQILAVRGAIEGERKQVSVLFCDIVSSSALAAELGPEEFHLVIDRFFRAALAEVHQYEGTVNQFLGDGFMALFGAPIAHEDHARRAVLAALGIAARAEMRIRIGINSGLVVVGTIGDDLRVDYTAFGDTTVLAARLQAAAEPGAVLLSQRTAGLVRGYFQLEEVTPVQVKERTVYPLRVMGLGTRTARIASGDEMSPFTGRDRELAELQRALEVTAGGEGQVVGLAGDPGLGKSRLALEFRRLAEDCATMIEGRCLSYGVGIAYLPLFELVRDACRIAADDPPNLAQTASAQGSVALLRRCEHDLAGRGVRLPAPGVLPMTCCERPAAPAFHSRPKFCMVVQQISLAGLDDLLVGRCPAPATSMSRFAAHPYGHANGGVPTRNRRGCGTDHVSIRGKG
jgi:class 3 adenylate cyclase